MKIPNNKQDRRRFIKEYLSQYQNKSFYCRALDCDVKVTDKSIEETAFQAAISNKPQNWPFNYHRLFVMPPY